MMKLLLGHGADPRLPAAGAPNSCAFWDVVYRKRYEMSRILLEAGADPNAMVELSGTPMMHARKDPELFELLNKCGGKHETTDEAALGRLIGDNDLKGVDALLDEEYRSTPLGMAARWGRAEMVSLLLERGASASAAGASWAEPMAWAKKKGHADVEGLLQSPS